MSELSRDEAWALVTEYIQSESLRRHCLSVETAMRAYAVKYGESPENWGAVGLVHDFDYEIHPTLDQHPQDGVPILIERGYPDWAIDAVSEPRRSSRRSARYQPEDHAVCRRRAYRIHLGGGVRAAKQVGRGSHAAIRSEEDEGQGVCPGGRSGGYASRGGVHGRRF